jgi:hypothetical protein
MSYLIRYQYKDQRINKIQMLNEKISKEIILPPIHNNNSFNKTTKKAQGMGIKRK